jgi:hypothetical protein
VLQEKASRQQEERREQIAEEQRSIQSDGPTVITEDWLPVRNKKSQAIH